MTSEKEMSVLEGWGPKSLAWLGASCAVRESSPYGQHWFVS